MTDNFPQHWQMLPLEDCMEAILDYRGKTPKKSDYGVPLVTAKIVKEGRIEWDSKPEFIAFNYFDEWMRRGLPKPSDVVMTTEAPLGEIAQLDDRKVALAQRLITLRGKPDLLDNTFLKFLMLSRFVQGQIKARATGTTVIGIKQRELRKIELPLPPLPEQKAIAHILGTLDDKIELNRHMNTTLEEMARAIFKSWFVDFDPVYAKGAGEDPIGMDAETAELFPDSFIETELGPVPEGWRIVPFPDLVEILSGGTPKTSMTEYWDGSIAWVSAKDVKAAKELFILETERQITELGLRKSSAKMLPKKTTIVTARGSVGNYCLLGREMSMNQTNYGLRGKKGVGDFFTFFSLVNMVGLLQQHSYGTIFDTITRKTFNNALIVRPPNELINEFEEEVSPLMDMVLDNQKESCTLADLRDTLLPKLISGEVRVGELKL